MRVALLSCNARAGDAVGNQAAEKLAFFRDRGAEVRVFLQEVRATHPQIRPFVTAVSDADAVGLARQLADDFDLVLADYSQHYALLAALPLAGQERTRVILDYHGVTPPEHWPGNCPPAVEEGVRRRGLVWCADAALAHSAFAEEELCQATGFPRDRVHRLGYPLDVERFAPGTPARDLRRQLGLKTARLVLFVGRLAPNKRVGLLVEALARLPDVQVVVVGDLGDLYQVEAERCRQRARELGVAERFHLLGRVSEQQLLAAYRSADVLAMPSVHEGFCLPVVEALACGVPVVAAHAGALPETVGAVGPLFAPDDADDLTRCLESVLMEDATARAERRQRGRTWANTFARDRWRDQFSRILEEILHAPPRARRRRLHVRPRSDAWTVSDRVRALLLPVELRNEGTVPVLPDGLSRTVLRGQVLAANSQASAEAECAALPQLVLPGQMLAVALSVPVPEQAGEYEVRLWAEQEDVPIRAAEATVRLTVAASAATSDSSRRADVLHAALTEAERLRCLPDDYLDVSEGWLARVKRWLKRKLLTNFKRGYVDVLSRRQSAFNRQMLAAVRALAEAHLQDKPTSDGGDNPRREVAALRETLARLEQRLLQLEARASSVEEVRI